jgi:hypothetical protein
LFLLFSVKFDLVELVLRLFSMLMFTLVV